MAFPSRPADWLDYRGHALLREDTRFVFRAGTGSRSIDRLTTLTALADTVRFNDQKDGMLGMRVARARADGDEGGSVH